jgi:hydrogenase/urease accessory protein HupE
LRVLLAIALSVLPAASHELWVTGLAVDLRAGGTEVTARVHRQNVGGPDAGHAIRERIRIRIDDRPFEASGISLRADLANDLYIWTATSPQSGSVVTVERPVFPDLAADRTVVSVTREGRPVGSAVLDATARDVKVGETLPALLLRFLGEGVRHILEGADHIAFLLAILLPVRRIGDLVKVVTAFTLAHSITLTLGATGLASIPAQIVEPAIALSIVIAAVENLHRGGAGTRLRAGYAFVFGLVHGFGFAGSLADSGGLPAYALWPSVLAFNTGVELGQLLIVAALAPLAVALQNRRPLLRAAVVRYASVAIAVLGLAWSVQRLAA